jgi:hypothetical protein
MDVRFEEPRLFERAAASFAIGGAAGGAAGSLPMAAAGSALALLLLLRPEKAALGRWAAAAGCCAAVAVCWQVAPLAGSPAACGAMLGLFLAIVRRDVAAGRAAAPLSPFTVALAAGLSACAVVTGAATLPHLSAALATVVPTWAAGAFCGSALGLWSALAAAPLHIRIGGDAIEERFAALRLSLAPELRALAERAMIARRNASRAVPDGAGADVRAPIDSLTAAALDLAARAAEVSRASGPEAEEHLRQRVVDLAQKAESTGDGAAKQSYLRAADALSSQLEHLQRVRRVRERALARLHEEVANLERAGFSLTLLDAPGSAAELQLLHDRLRHGATVLEETGEIAAPAIRARLE